MKKRCRHPVTALRWSSKDEVFICLKCGQIIFPTEQPEPGDDFTAFDDALCLVCGGTGRTNNAPCAACQGEGYLMEEQSE